MADTHAPTVVVVGSYNRDVVLNVPRFPAPGETLLGATRIETPGGKGSNQAIHAARCGASVGIVAAVGADPAGSEALELWRAEGIDTSGVARLSGIGTGLATILVDASGENMIVVDSGANARLGPEHVDEAAGLIAGAKVVVAQLEIPLASVRRTLEIARAHGVLTVLNAAPANAALDADLLGLVDVLVVNAGEGRALTGRQMPTAVARTLARRVGLAAVVTLGARGALACMRDGELVRRPAMRVRVVDTTGAGDAFVAALARGLAMTRSVSRVLDLAIVAGAFACTTPGAIAPRVPEEEPGPGD